MRRKTPRSTMFASSRACREQFALIAQALPAVQKLLDLGGERAAAMTPRAGGAD